MKNIYQERKILVVCSSLPFLVWLSLGISGNVEVSGIEYFVCFINYLLLALLTPINSKIAKGISILCLIIISTLLALEGRSNDVFGPLYPYFILIFCAYYIILNIISIRKCKI